MQEKKNLLDIIKRTKEAIKNDDVFSIKELSNHTIHTASIYSDPDSITIAVIVYAISKVVERKDYRGYKEWKAFIQIVNKELDTAASAISNDNSESLRKSLISLRRGVSKLSGPLQNYIENVFRRVQINKASRIYEHGVSMQQTAEMLGITLFELAEYSGRTGIADVDLSITRNVKDRIRIAEELFR